MSAFQPNKFQPIWRYIQKDITILSLVVGSSRKSESLFIFLIFVPLLVSFVRQHGQHICSTWQKLLHLFPHAGQQPAGAQQLLYLFLSTGQQLTKAAEQQLAKLAAPLQPLGQLLQTTNHTAPSLYAAVHAWQQHGMEKLNLLDSSSMVCTIPQSWTAPTTHHLQQLLRSWKRQHLLGNPLPRHLQLPKLLDSSIHSLPFQQIQAGSKDKKGGESKGGDHPEIRKIKGESGEKKNKEGDWAETFGGQQGHGRVFNTKFSKDLHVWLKLSLGFW
jgi:hypothetical protein